MAQEVISDADMQRLMKMGHATAGPSMPDVLTDDQMNALSGATRPDNSAILAQQAAKYPTSAEQGGTPGAPATPVLNEPMGGLGSLIFGVDPTVFGHRILGALSTLTNTAFPAGDTPRPPTDSQLTPQEEIGQKAAVLPAAMDIAGAVAKPIAKAGLRAVTSSEDLAARAAANKAIALKPVTLEQQAAAQRIAPEMAQRRMGTGLRGSTIDANIKKANVEAGRWVAAAEQRLTEEARPEFQVAKQDMLDEIQATSNSLDPNLFPDARRALERAANSVNRLSDQANAKDVIKLRRDLDQAAEEMGGFKEAGPAVDRISAKVFRGVGDMVRGRLNDMDPGLAKANHEYWLTRKAVDIAERRQLGEVGKVGTGLPGRGSLLDDIIASGVGGSVGGPAGAAAAEGLNLARQTRGFANVKSGLQQSASEFIERPKAKPAGLLTTGTPRMGAPATSGINVETGDPLVNGINVYGTSHGTSVKLGPNQVPPTPEPPEGYGTGYRKAVKLGPNKTPEPSPPPEGYNARYDKAVKLRANKVEDPEVNPEGYGAGHGKAVNLKAAKVPEAEVNPESYPGEAHRLELAKKLRQKEHR